MVEAGTPSTVMVVDDAASTLSLVGAILSRHGYRVVRCADGSTALDHARSDPPDLVLLDIVMPEMDGYQICTQLRQGNGMAEVPVVFMSAIGDTDAKAAAFAAGGVDFLTKPFGQDELLARVGLQLERARRRREELGQVRGLDALVARRTAELAASARALQNRTAHLESLIATLPDLTFVKDRDGVYLDVNPRTAELFGRRVEEVVGRRDIDLLSEDTARMVREQDRQAIAAGGPVTFEERMAYPDGRMALFETTKTPMFDGHGELIGVLGVARDITDRAQAREELARSRAELLRAHEVAGIGSWTVDLGADEVVPQTYRLFGLPEDRLIDFAAFWERIHPDDRERVREAWQAALHEGDYEVDHRLEVDGEIRWIREQAKFERDAQGRPVRAVGTALDITHRKVYEQNLKVEQARLNAALEAAQAATWEWHVPTDHFRFSDRCGALRGDDAAALESSRQEWEERLHPDDRAVVLAAIEQVLDGSLPRLEIEYRTRHRDAHWVWLRTLGRVMERTAAGSPVTFLGIDLDITEQKAHQAQMEFAANHDGLTGLINRQRFAQQLHFEVERCRQGHDGLALIYLDLDGFEAINRTAGRVGGNQMLVEVATRLLGTVELRDHVARIGGDEFAVILRGPEPVDWTEPVRELLEIIARPVVLRGRQLVSTASVGVTLFPQAREVDAEQLLRQADQAVYQAKLAGKNRSHLFDTDHDASTRQRYEQLAEVADALDKRQFVLHYQPKVNLRSGEVRGFEALIRWQHPQRGLLPPGAFIPLLEDHLLSIDLGDWVIEEALAQLARWRGEGLLTSVSVNVDPMQLLDPDFPDRLDRQLRDQPDVAPEQFEIEILETGALEDMARVSPLVTRLRELGVSVALDDFGTGYSSLTFLKQLATGTIKIDRSFVMDLPSDADHAVIVDSILGLARRFNRAVVAEGIESEDHGRVLIELGCELGQGYGIGRPMPPGAVHTWLTGWQPMPSWRTSRPVEVEQVPAVLAEIHHRAWRTRVLAALSDPAQVPPAVDAARCNLGLWLDELQQADVEDPRVSGFITSHEAVHRLAEDALGMRAVSDEAELQRRADELFEASDVLTSELFAFRQARVAAVARTTPRR